MRYSLSLLLTGLLVHSPGALAAEAALPTALESCADVDPIVGQYQDWNVQPVERAADGRWTEAIIRAGTTPGSRGLSVRESDIELFVQCWERAYSSGQSPSTYVHHGMYGISSVVSDLFPMTERVALALTALAGRLVDDERVDLGSILTALRFLAVGPRDPAEEADRARIGAQVTTALREQWWRCWKSRSGRSVERASYDCQAYSDTTDMWLFGLLGPGDQDAIQRAVATLARMLDRSSDENERQVAVLAVFARDSWEIPAGLRLKALKSPDPAARLMAVRLSRGAGLDDDGQPMDPELRNALQEISRQDPDRKIREEAIKILALPPYGGVG